MNPVAAVCAAYLSVGCIASAALFGSDKVVGEAIRNTLREHPLVDEGVLRAATMILMVPFWPLLVYGWFADKGEKS